MKEKRRETDFLLFPPHKSRSFTHTLSRPQPHVNLAFFNFRIAEKNAEKHIFISPFFAALASRSLFEIAAGKNVCA